MTTDVASAVPDLRPVPLAAILTARAAAAAKVLERVLPDMAAPVPVAAFSSAI